VEIESDLTGFGDRPLIAAVLNNLFSNALKYTHQQDHPRIHFGRCSESLNQQAVFYVADNGIGFNMAYVHKLFVPFSRLHSRADYPGSGIGLSHAQRIIHRHGGEIWAEAEDGKGATFYFTLSVNPEDALRLARTILTPLEMASSAP
jgi:light-regulated signal transduction histidine kinase (bacteriophytochrome)